MFGLAYVESVSVMMKVFRGLSWILVVWLLVIFFFVAFVGWHHLKDISIIHDMAVKIEKLAARKQA